jgi:hypothetical protein
MFFSFQKWKNIITVKAEKSSGAFTAEALSPQSLGKKGDRHLFALPKRSKVVQQVVLCRFFARPWEE